jgi:hypothetical protein
VAYPEYTKCTSVDIAAGYSKNSGTPWGYVASGILVGTLANVGGLYVLQYILGLVHTSMDWGPAALAPVIGLLLGLINYCDWWLNYRLICLDDDHNHCVVGFVAEIEDPKLKESDDGSFWDQLTSFFDQFDNDFSMNIGIQGTWFEDAEANNLDYVSGVQPFGYLLKDATANKSILEAGYNLDGETAPATSGVYAKYGPYAQYAHSPLQVLHVEFEGGGVARFQQWLQALTVLVVAAEALWVGCSAGLFWACLLLILVAAALFLLGPVAVANALSTAANPGDIDKSLGSLKLGDVVLVRGRWVYDTPHKRGWNELHPIRHCQILVGGPFVFDGWDKLSPPLNYDKWCNQVATAASPLVKNEQKKAENAWEIHPLVDGCTPSYQPPDQPGPKIENVSNVSLYNNCRSDYTVTASVSDPSGVAKVELWYKPASQESWETKPMVLNSSSGLYGAVITYLGTTTYFVRASNAKGNQLDSAQYSTLLYCPA